MTQGKIWTDSGSNNPGVPASATIENRLVNGEMDFDQVNEGASVSISNANTASFVTDQWQILVSDSNISGVTGQQVADAPTGFLNSLKVTFGTGSATVAAGNYAILYQDIESPDVIDLAIGSGSPATISLSMWVKSNISGTFGIFLQNSAGNRSYVALGTTTAATWTQVSINSILLDNTGTWLTAAGTTGLVIGVAMICGSTAQGTAGAWAGSNKLTTSAQTNYGGTSANTFQITGVKIAKEGDATPIVRAPYQQRLERCLRFYEKTIPAGTAVGQNKGLPGALQTTAQITTAGSVEHNWRFRVPKAKSPTIVTYNPSIGNANWRDVTGSSDVIVSVDPDTAKSTNDIVISTQTTTFTANHRLYIHATADARI